MGKTKSGRVRVRIDDRSSPERMEKLRKGLKAAQARAPRKANGKMLNNFKFKNLLDGGLDPSKPGPVSKTYGGQSALHRDPPFVKDKVLRKKILMYLRRGVPYQTMCNACGVKINTFLSWLAKGKAGSSRHYMKFYRSVCRAEAAGEIAILDQLKKHASADWRVNAWQLERIWPEKYGRVDRIRAETRATVSITTDTKKDLGDKVVKDDIAKELARRMIDGDAQLTFNALPKPERTNA